MIKLLNKEFKLSIHPLFHLIPLLTGVLLLIPQWVYFVAFMYFYWIAVPNILGTYNTQNDLLFSTFMPVKKSDIVKSKILALSLMELFNIAVAAIFALLHNRLFGTHNFLFDLNFAFFGFVFIMNGLFNMILFPGYFKTGYKIALPVVTACIAVIIYGGAIETLILVNNGFRESVENLGNLTLQLSILLGGILIFILLTSIAYKISAKRFEVVEL